jgi:hypothetical protein
MGDDQKDNLDLKHYWICFVCATLKGGKLPKDDCSTVMHGDCKYCNRSGTLWPWVDFNWPSKSLTARAAIQRD